MSAPHRRLPENAPGDFYVNDACIDCATCTWVVPSVFTQGEGASYVRQQPAGVNERHRARMALLACPVAAIMTERCHDLAGARAGFPDPIDGPVYHCGYHASASFGAASYLVVRDGGNILVDSPRFTPSLVRRIEAMGGIDLMFLTHCDDVADHARFAAHFGCARVMHAGDVGPRTRAVERIVDGDDPLDLGDGAVAIPVPGHTRGSMCLLIDDTWLFTGDHLGWDPVDSRLLAYRDVCWFDWSRQTGSMAQLCDHRFEWVLPGHGYRGYLPAAAMRRALTQCVERMRVS
jgi:glyoxylase-like metal-dependent hydrolase (beta-lactamase superfamily II)/ferredoxin